MNKFKGMEIMYTIGKYIICYAQWDMGNKYKLYKKVNDHYQYVYADSSLSQMLDYTKHINKTYV